MIKYIVVYTTCNIDKFNSSKHYTIEDFPMSHKFEFHFLETARDWVSLLCEELSQIKEPVISCVMIYEVDKNLGTEKKIVSKKIYKSLKTGKVVKRNVKL